MSTTELLHGTSFAVFSKSNDGVVKSLMDTRGNFVARDVSWNSISFVPTLALSFQHESDEVIHVFSPLTIALR